MERKTIKLIRSLFAVICIFMGVNLRGSESFNALIPKPQQAKYFNRSLPLNTYSISGSGEECQNSIEILKEILTANNAVAGDSGNSAKIRFELVKSITGVSSNGRAEGYKLQIGDSGIILQAITPLGLGHGVQTIRQLLYTRGNTLLLQHAEITDYPAFKIRGQMHDIGRNFIAFERLKKELDIMALYKLNTFHWHLTDNEGWRIEIKSHPELTSPKAQSRLFDKFYTQKQIKELVKYALKRGINIIPEIDIPGHSLAFRKATGVDMQSRKGMKILKDVFKEVVEIFPSPYIHIGADEVRIKRKNFLPKMIKYIKSFDRDIVMWNPGNPVNDSSVIIQNWSCRYPAPRKGLRNIDSSLFYTDATLSQLAAPIQIFNSSILNIPEGNDLMLGGIVCHWVERSYGAPDDIFTQNPIYTSIIPLAERSWQGKGFDKDDGVMGLPGTGMYDEFCDFEDRLIAHRDTFLKDFPVNYIRQSNIEWRVLGPLDNDGKFNKKILKEQNIPHRFYHKRKSYRSELARGGCLIFGNLYEYQNFGLFKGSFANKTAYAQTWIYSPAAQDKHMWIDLTYIQRCGRKGLPKQGTWDSFNSKIYLNGKELTPPDWSKRDRPEGAYSLGTVTCRPPTKITLKKGWNKLFIRSNIGYNSHWQVTAAVIDFDGKKATEPAGIYYSADKIMKK